MNASKTPQARSRWGRSRLGGGTAALITASLAIGAAVSSGLGLLAQATLPDRGQPWLLFAVFAVVTLPVTSIGAWALLVDRSTITGAVDDPDESVENRWYERAATASFHVLLSTLGLGLTVFVFLRIDISPSVLTLCYLVIAMVAFGVNYLLTKRRDG